MFCVMAPSGAQLVECISPEWLLVTRLTDICSGLVSRSQPSPLSLSQSVRCPCCMATSGLTKCSVTLWPMPRPHALFRADPVSLSLLGFWYVAYPSSVSLSPEMLHCDSVLHVGAAPESPSPPLSISPARGPHPAYPRPPSGLPQLPLSSCTQAPS